MSSSVKAFRHSRHSRHSTPPTPPTPPTPLDTPDTPDTLDTGLSIADILHLSSPLRPAQALPLPPPVLHPVLLPPPLLLPPLSQVLQLLRLPLLTVALREHRRARRAPGHDARLLFRVLLPRRLGCKCCSFLLYHSLRVTVAVMHTPAAARDRQSTHTTAAASHSKRLPPIYVVVKVLFDFRNRNLQLCERMLPSV